MPAERRARMLYRISVEGGFIRAELFGRETVEETIEVLDVVADTALRHGTWDVLVSVHDSRPLFRLEPLLEHFSRLGERLRFRIALVADSDELHIAHQYAEFRALQQGAAVKCFRGEREAAAWLVDAPSPAVR